MPLSTRPEVLTSCPCDTCTNSPLSDRPYSLFQHPATGGMFWFCTDYVKELESKSARQSETTASKVQEAANATVPASTEDSGLSAAVLPACGEASDNEIRATEPCRAEEVKEIQGETQDTSNDLGPKGTWGLPEDCPSGTYFTIEVPDFRDPWLPWVDFTVRVAPHQVKQYEDLRRSVSVGEKEDATDQQRDTARLSLLILHYLENRWARSAYTAMYNELHPSLCQSQLAGGGDAHEVREGIEDEVGAVSPSEDEPDVLRMSGTEGV